MRCSDVLVVTTLKITKRNVQRETGYIEELQ